MVDAFQTQPPPIVQRLRQKILVLDGAYGTTLQNLHLPEADYRGTLLKNHVKPVVGNHDLLNLSRPDIVEEIHASYLEAGADIISTNTFSATTLAQLDFGTESVAMEINQAGAELARRVADRYSTPQTPRFVAGSIGPTNRSASLSPDVERPSYRNISFDELFLP